MTSNPSSYTTPSAAVFLTVNATLGAGLLNMPFAFKEGGGILPSLIMQVLLLLLAMGGLFILTYCTNIAKVDSFQNLVDHFCGSRAKSWTSVAIFLYSFGCCLTFMIIIGDQIDRILASTYGSDYCHFWYMNRSFTMTVISMAFILPLSFSSSISFLKYPSYCGVIVMSYVLLLAFFEWQHHDRRSIGHDISSKAFAKHPLGNLLFLPPTHHSILHALKHSVSSHYMDVIRVVPAICFAYQCHLSWIPTLDGMKNKSVSSVSQIVTIVSSFVICFAAYTLISIFGLLTFGENIASDLMVNYDASKVGVLVAIVVIAFKTVTTYPVILFCARTAIDDALVKILRIESPTESELLRRVLIVLIWFLSTLIFAIYVPDISSTINLVGGLAILFIFFLPGVCLISAAQVQRCSSSISATSFTALSLIGALYVLIGAFIFGVTFTQVIMKDFVDTSLKPETISLCIP
jgi:sodium-coupled neutral amino acid transporter 7/8